MPTAPVAKAEAGPKVNLIVRGGPNNVPAMALVVFLAVASITCSRKVSPETAFDHAWQTFQDGDLVRAQTESRAAHLQFHDASQYWAWKFTLLTARILYRRGLYGEAQAELAAESAALPTGDLTVKRLWLQGVINTSLHNFAIAKRELTDAEHICASADFPSCTVVPSAR